ncbi:PfkB family carbohydrate kinase [Candidatus Palauibacter sp.]|uniref:PfkB family carbohydrate kinase n=1 Tax=Candidatus Palauibacter sp. TaxID=3101350 RepID=UPI003C6EF82D
MTAVESAGNGVHLGPAPILVVGSVALDEITTPTGHRGEVVGGTAVNFSAAASLFAPVQLVGVIGDDYPTAELEFLRRRGTDLTGLERRPGRSFRWGGVYHRDMKTRDTAYTELGVFSEFEPTLPASFRGAGWAFLGAIDPALQLSVLDQLAAPRLVACDTMNYWIERTPERLGDVISKIDLLTLNDEEARQLSEEPNLTRAARWIQRRGPRHVVIKKGEHGAVLFSGDDIFLSTGFPLENVVDPTGAGDAFAGGLLGYLARCGSVTGSELRRAIVYGCALGSFACEAFGAGRIARLTAAEVEERVRSFREMTTFDMPARRVET